MLVDYSMSTGTKSWSMITTIKAVLNSKNALKRFIVNHFHLCRYQENVKMTTLTLALLISIRHRKRLYRESIHKSNNSNNHPYDIYKKCCTTGRRWKKNFTTGIFWMVISVKNVRRHFGISLNDSKTQWWQVIASCKRSWNSKSWHITNAFNDFSVILVYN